MPFKSASCSSGNPNLEARKYKFKYYGTCKMKFQKQWELKRMGQTAITIRKESDLFISLKAENQ